MAPAPSTSPCRSAPGYHRLRYRVDEIDLAVMGVAA
jgi:hypothetical protein